MTEINSGVRAILKHGWIYRLSQLLFGEKTSKQYIIDNYLAGLTPDSSLLDMGCGAGNFAYFIPQNVCYIGFDPNVNYIESATKNFSEHKNFYFYAGTAVSQAVNDHIDDASVDYAIVHGVMHHISDGEITEFFNLAKRALKPGGKLICLEPVWIENQSPVKKLVMRLDRGKNIKQQSQWLALAHENSGTWATLYSQICKNLIRFYDLIVIEITKTDHNESPQIHTDDGCKII